MLKKFTPKSFFTKVLLLMIVAVMGLSGVNQMFTDNTNNYVAKVGKNEISTGEYQQAYDVEKANMQRMLNMALSIEQLEALGFKRIVLDRLVQSALLDNLIESMHFNIGDRSITQAIKQVAEFQDTEGKFNKEKFLSVLHDNNVNEPHYIEHIKEVLMRNIILDAFKYLPGSYMQIADKIYNHRFEQRVVDISILTSDMVKNIPTPSEQDLQNFYQQHKIWSPEYREAKYVIVTKNNTDNTVTVGEDEILSQLKELDNRIDIAYTVAKSTEEADNILNELKVKNKTISELPEHQIMENLTKGMLPKHLQEIFSLAEGEISNPIKTPAGFYLFQIEKKYKVSTEERKSIMLDIQREIKNSKINERLEDLINSLEEQLSSGAAMEQLAKTYNLQVNDTGAIDINYHDQKLAQLVFNQDGVKGNNCFFTSFTNDDDTEEYYNINVTEIIPPKLKDFNECKDQVRESWISEFINKKLYEMAKSGNEKQHNIKQEAIFRTKVAYTESPQQNYPEAFVEQVFNIIPGESTLPMEYQQDKIIVGKLVKIKQATQSEAITKEIEEQIKRNILEGIYSEFKHYLYNKFPVSINEKARVLMPLD